MSEDGSNGNGNGKKRQPGKKRVCIDFDGVIHRYSNGYQDGTVYDIPMPGVKEFLEGLHDQGYDIYVHTSRPMDTYDYNVGINIIKEYMDKHGLPYDYVTAMKVPAIAYIDDRAINFNGNWNTVCDELKRLEVGW